MSAASRTSWRLIDTGLRPAAENIAINRAMLEARQEGLIPNTLRFLRFLPSALVGYHQCVEQELRTDYCTAHGIAIQRRVTGGGAIYFDETQIGWELYLDRRTLGTADMQEISRRICEMAAAGIRRLGVDARFRPRNDIEVDGKKISGTGGAFEGGSILYQGTLLIEFDVEKMLRVLRIPAEKLSDKAIASARERVANLKDLLGTSPRREAVMQSLARSFAEGFGVEFEPAAEMNFAEREKFHHALAEIDHPDWIDLVSRPLSEAPLVEGLHRTTGGLLRVALGIDLPKNRIKQAWFTGDFFVNPRRMIVDLEAALRDTPLDELHSTVDGFFRSYPVEMLQLRPADFVQTIENALASLAGAPLPMAGGAPS
ncbi:MAG: lipoate--protein ligase family protein [Gammaproteobacteria bacterium]|nr:lipoate--protein ligase family protein [Gammaproteobacteria bacterium]